MSLIEELGGRLSASSTELPMGELLTALDRLRAAAAVLAWVRQQSSNPLGVPQLGGAIDHLEHTVHALRVAQDSVAGYLAVLGLTTEGAPLPEQDPDRPDRRPEPRTDTRPPDTRPTDTRPPEARPPDNRSPDAHPPGARPPGVPPPGIRPPDGAPPGIRPTEPSPLGLRPTEPSPLGLRPTDSRLDGSQPNTTQPGGARWPEPRPGAPRPAGRPEAPQDLATPQPRPRPRPSPGPAARPDDRPEGPGAPPRQTPRLRRWWPERVAYLTDGAQPEPTTGGAPRSTAVELLRAVARRTAAADRDGLRRELADAPAPVGLDLAALAPTVLHRLATDLLGHQPKAEDLPALTRAARGPVLDLLPKLPPSIVDTLLARVCRVPPGRGGAPQEVPHPADTAVTHGVLVGVLMHRLGRDPDSLDPGATT
jgi:hypothetical protein